jgi:hypothetical protein
VGTIEKKMDDDDIHSIIVDRKGVTTVRCDTQIMVPHDYLALLYKVSKEGSK